ncbi:MAG: PQQ-dependent sugar dehydrogenase [Phycisphaerales bacterium]
MHDSRLQFFGVFVAVALGSQVAVLPAALAQNQPPATPGVTEPPVGRIVNPADCHMECTAFSDPNPGDTHLCSDWEIWTVSPSQRVWFTSCIGGVERVHTHLGDGAFEGSHAGRSELLPNTQYRLRVRHRDSSGQPATEWSGYGERLFSTGAASQIFPLEIDDIEDLPAPTLRSSIGQPIVLPGAPAGQPSVVIENASGNPLLEFRGVDGVSNQVINAAALAAHFPVRLHISAGALGAPLVLPDTDLTFNTHDAGSVTVYIPAVSVAPGAANDAYFWITSSGSTYVGSAGQSTPDFSQLARGNPVPWIARQPGYRVEIVASGFQLPCNIVFVPNPGPNPNSPIYYVTELYGTIKVVTRDGAVRDYATGLLNFNPTGNFPGSGEQGLTGLAVDPANGDVYAAMLYSSVPGQEAVPHYPKVVRFTSMDGGLSAATQTTILDMVGESQGQSHQISNLTFGPDGMLYQHMGDGFDASTAQNLNSYRGKILRLMKTGAAPVDNPFYSATDGITSRDYVYAYGVRNPFGGAWRASDGSHYEVENGPSVDRFAKIVRARNYLWNGSDASMANFAIYNWAPATGPVNIAFIQPGTFGGSQFPPEKFDHAFVSESGPTWATGPQGNGKRISEFVLDAAGNLVSGPTPLIEYVGGGKATVVGLTAGPDGLYFTDLYKDLGYASPIDRGANILRVKFVGDAAFTADVTSGTAPLSVQFADQSTVPSPSAWLWDFGDGSSSTLQNPAHTYNDDGLYTVRLSVTGANGLAVAERPGFIRVGAVPTMALISSSLPAPASDLAVADHLRSVGYEVTILDDEPANRPSAAEIAANYGLVLVSSTLASGNVAGEFRTANVPMVFWENALLRPGRESLTDNGVVVGGSTTIDIINNAHPITQHAALGNLVVFSSGQNMSVGTGTVGAGTQVLARRAGSTDIALMAADAGATVAGGYVTPARRVFMFFEDSSFLAATHDAEHLLEHAVCWAMNLSEPTITAQPQNVAVPAGQSAMFSVTVSGSGPLSYQWQHNSQAIPGATTRTLILTDVMAADAGSYRVTVSNTCGESLSSAGILTVTAACPCDWNASGSLTSQDFFDFIAAFFSNNADFNNDGATSSQDFFDFLACFFTGC